MPDAKTLSPSRSWDILLLTLVAGSADALGFLNQGRVFTSNMTGNVVLTAIALTEGRSADTLRSLFALASFIAGLCAGGWLWRLTFRGRSEPLMINIILAVEAGELLAYAVGLAVVPPERLLDMAYLLIAPLGVGMGLQAAVLFRMGTPGVTTTAITGTLTSLFSGMTKTGRIIPPPGMMQTTMGVQTAVIVLYAAGAAAAGALNVYAHPWAGFLPAVIVVVTVTARLARQKLVSAGTS